MVETCRVRGLMLAHLQRNDPLGGGCVATLVNEVKHTTKQLPTGPAKLRIVFKANRMVFLTDKRNVHAVYALSNPIATI